MRTTVALLLATLFTLAACASGEPETEGSLAQGERSVSEPPASERADRQPQPQSPPAVQIQDTIAGRRIPTYRGFSTDFSLTTIEPQDILDGGPPKDGIPAIDDPKFISIAEAARWMESDEPVFAVSADGTTHLYPVQILTYHEIVNDVIGTTPVTVTYCPLCNTGISFLRDFDGQILDFGTTGRLRYSNLLMYDRQTESWWQQATGEGVVGEYAGYQLELYPMQMLPWDRAVERYPDAAVLSRETGFARNYGTNPYVGYDTGDPFLYRGPATPGELNPMARVVQIVVDGATRAVPYPVVAEQGFVEHTVGGTPVVVFWEPGTASALDTRDIAAGRDVGSANAFARVHDGVTLEFESAAGGFTDVQTGSLWDATGLAVSGELSGARLEPVVGIQHFWFSYSAFALDERWPQDR